MVAPVDEQRGYMAVHEHLFSLADVAAVFLSAPTKYWPNAYYVKDASTKQIGPDGGWMRKH
jgi:hypothetical protein